MICYKNLSQIITLEAVVKKDGRNLLPEDLSIQHHKSIVFDSNQILWIGDFDKLPGEYNSAKVFDAHGKLLLPGLVDSHTHLVFGGDRSSEYTMRLNGESYQAIADAGGGIKSTVKQTTTLSEEELFQASCNKIDKLLKLGIKALEIKSGYGLDYENEKKLTLVIQKLKETYKNKLIIFNTYLAAHAIPEKYKNSTGYINDIVLPLLKELAPLNIIDAVDIFHEEGYFSDADVNILFQLADQLGIAKKIHADEFNDNNGAKLAVESNCLSCDHLFATSESNIKLLAQSNTVATLLPGTGLFLGKTQANARAFLDAGAKVAIASDYNPGSSHFPNLLLISSIAGINMKFNLCELIAAITFNAASALALKDIGSIEVGKKPFFNIYDTDSLDKLFYNWNENFFIEDFQAL